MKDNKNKSEKIEELRKSLTRDGCCRLIEFDTIYGSPGFMLDNDTFKYIPEDHLVKYFVSEKEYLSKLDDIERETRRRYEDSNYKRRSKKVGNPGLGEEIIEAMNIRFGGGDVFIQPVRRRPENIG